MEKLNLESQKKRVKNGQLYCLIRKKWIECKSNSKKNVREEIVRQAFLKYLIDEVKVPKSNIYVEEALTHWNIDKKYRADIIVSYDHKKDDDKVIYPLILIECKAENIEVEQAITQVKEYQKDLGAKIVIITNGYQTQQIESNKISKVLSLPSYEKIISNKKIDAIKIPLEKPIKHQIPFPKKEHDRYVDSLIKVQIDKKYYDFIIALDQFFRFNLDDDIIRNSDGEPKIDRRTISIGETRYDYLGNASGGKFRMQYRIFYYKEQEILVSLSSIKNGSKTGPSTILICGTEHNPSLQLNFNKYIDNDKLEGNQFRLWHNGRTGSGITKDTIVQRVKKELPHLTKNDKIELGIIDITHKLEWDTMKPIVKNILDYVLLRKKMREEKKNN